MTSAVVGTPVVLAVTFLGDDEETGVPADGQVTVNLGGAPFAAVADVDVPGRYTLTWVPELVGRYVVAWTGVFGSSARTVSTVVQVRTKRLLSVAQARSADEALEDRDKYPASLLVEYVDLVQDEFERILGWDLIPDLGTSAYLPTGDVPADLLWAAKKRLSWLLLSRSSSVPDRATSFTAADGGGTYTLSTPGRGGAETGIPDVDAVLKRHAAVRVGIA